MVKKKGGGETQKSTYNIIQLYEFLEQVKLP